MQSNSIYRNVILLALCQAMFMSGQSAVFATVPLAGHMLLGANKSLATLPIVLLQLGIMSMIIPASFLMKQIGRRAGFTIGALLGIVAAGISVWALYVQSFEILCVGSFLQGTSAGFSTYYRFAAADVAEDNFKSRAISLVLVGGVIAAFLGPQSAKWAVDWFAPLTYMGIYILIGLFSITMLLLIQGLRIPKPTPEERLHGGRSLRVLARQPAFIVAVLSSMFGYGVMTLIMTTTPIAMMICGFSFGDSASVIQFHLLAMFLPAFFTGHLVNRFGALPIIAVGVSIEAACALVNMSGIEFTNFAGGLILLGAGWNLTYVGGSSLLTQTYEPAEKAKAQGAHDFMVFATTATAAGLSGYLLDTVGWVAVNAAALPAMALVFTAVMILMSHQRRVARQQDARAA